MRDFNRYYFHPPAIAPVFLVERRSLGIKPKNDTHQMRCRIFPRRYLTTDFVIHESHATRDSLRCFGVGDGYQNQVRRGYCRYYSVKGSGRDWDLDELNATRVAALAEIRYYRNHNRR
jgi:hypothetical protein